MDSDSRAMLERALAQTTQIKLHESDARPTLDELQKLLADHYERLQQMHVERTQAAGDVMASDLALIDLAIMATTQLLTLSREKTEHGRTLWTDVDGIVPSAEEHFHTLLVNGANTLASIRLLAAIGYDTQARSLVRRLHELTDLTLAILYDKDTFLHYADKTEDFEQIYAIWRKHLAPGKLRRVLSNFYKEIGVEQEVLDSDHADFKHRQRWLSLAAHNYYLNSLIEVEHTDVTEDQRFQFKLHPLHFQGAGATIRTACHIQSEFLTVVQALLVMKHDWKWEGAAAFRLHLYRGLLLVGLDYCNDEAEVDDKALNEDDGNESPDAGDEWKQVTE